MEKVVLSNGGSMSLPTISISNATQGSIYSDPDLDGCFVVSHSCQPQHRQGNSKLRPSSNKPRPLSAIIEQFEEVLPMRSRAWSLNEKDLELRKKSVSSPRLVTRSYEGPSYNDGGSQSVYSNSLPLLVDQRGKDGRTRRVSTANGIGVPFTKKLYNARLAAVTCHDKAVRHVSEESPVEKVTLCNECDDDERQVSVPCHTELMSQAAQLAALRMYEVMLEVKVNAGHRRPVVRKRETPVLNDVISRHAKSQAQNPNRTHHVDASRLADSPMLFRRHIAKAQSLLDHMRHKKEAGQYLRPVDSQPLQVDTCVSTWSNEWRSELVD